MKTIKRKERDNTLSTIGTSPGWAFTVQDLYTSSEDLQKVQLQSSDNLSMQEHSRIYRLVLKLGVFVSRVMIRLSCRVSSVTLTCRGVHIQVGDINAQAPVGTTLALMERSMKVMSGVQARLHAALKKELRLLSSIVKDYMGPEYVYEMEGEFSRTKDFDDRVDVIPVSDPNAATMSQRIMQYQSALQLSQQAPQLYDMGKLHRQMLEVLGIDHAKEIIKLPDDIKPSDPVTENMAMLKQEPVKAFKYQDHEAHIQVHRAAIEDPKLREIVGQSPFAAAIQAAMTAHITEHVACQYRKEIEERLGVPMPDEEKPLPEDVEEELSRITAEAAGKLLTKNTQEAQQMEQQKLEKDHLTQIQRKELEIKEKELQHKIDLDNAKLELEKMKADNNEDIQMERIKSENKREGARLAVEVAKETNKATKDGTKLAIELNESLKDG